jgi:hypothetical protein
VCWIDRLAEPVLNASRVVAGIGQVGATGVAEHVARVDDIVEMPTDETGPRQSMRLFHRAGNFDAIDGKKFKLDPQRILFSLQFKHNARPPDFELTLLGDAQRWFRRVANLLLEALKCHNPRQRETLAAAGQGRPVCSHGLTQLR